MTSHNAIVTHIDTYEHLAGNHVNVVGMVHKADSDFYGYMQDFVDGRNAAGAITYYEGLLHPTDKQLRNMKPETIRKLGFFMDVMGVVDDLCKDTGLVSQEDAITVRAGWEHHDMPALDLINEIDERTMRKAERLLPMLQIAASFMSPKERRALFIDEVQKGIENPCDGGFLNISDAVLLGKRNEIVVAAMDDHEFEVEPGRDYVYVWGEGHRKGFGALLRERGFEQTDQIPVVAARV